MSGDDDRWNAFDLVPVSIWTAGTEHDGHRLRDALLDLAAEHRIGQLGAEPPQAGSWYQKLWLRFRAGLGSEEARDVLEKIRLSLEAHLVEEKIAQVDSLKSTSAAALIEAVRDQEQAIIVLGQLVIVKDRSKIVVVGVDPSTARAIERSRVRTRRPVRTSGTARRRETPTNTTSTSRTTVVVIAPRSGGTEGRAHGGQCLLGTGRRRPAARR